MSQERATYAMLGGSEVVVGTSIASYDLVHASWCCDDPPPRPRPLRTLTPLQDSRDLPGDYELRLPQERAKYAMFGGSEVVVGTSIASCDLMHASWLVLWRSAAAPPPSEPSHHSMTLRATFQI